MRRLLPIAFLAAACASLAVAVPAAMAAKPSITVTGIEGFSDGSGVAGCKFHAVVYYSTTGNKYASGLTANVSLMRGGSSSITSLGETGYASVTSSPGWASGVLSVATGSLPTASNYLFAVNIKKGNKLVASGFTTTFALDQNNYQLGCPAAGSLINDTSPTSSPSPS